jgi:uncharacterized protein
MTKKVSDKLVIVLKRKIVANQFKTAEYPVVDPDAISSKLDAHIRQVAERIDARRHVYYDGGINERDEWLKSRFIKYNQIDGDWGARLAQSVDNGFKKGYGRIVVVSTDCPQITTEDIQKAFDLLNKKQVVLGPKTDGTIYLLGLAVPCGQLFQNKPWGSAELFKMMYLDLLQARKNIGILEEKNHLFLGEFVSQLMDKEEE